MTLTIELIQEAEVPLEVDCVCPDKVDQRSLAEIHKLEIFHGNEKVEFGDFFRATGSPSEEIRWTGDFSGVHWIGKGMKNGTMLIDGNVGRHLGSEMAGGEIRVTGNAGDWVGAELKNGLIHVNGNAGHLVGSAYRGSPVGMRGGTIMIDGDAGNEIGHSIRRGLIGVGGRAGDLPGFNMLAGTILIFGECGIRPGGGMKRGTIGLFHEQPPQLLPTFRQGGLVDSVIFSLMNRRLQALGFSANEDRFQMKASRIFHGDFLCGGRGEIFLPM